jgi:thiol-disulfide isomerase/thioredoxin
MRYTFFTIFILVFAFNTKSQTPNFVINLTVEGLDTGYYKIDLTEITGVKSTAVMYTDILDMKKKSIKIQGYVPEERYVYFNIRRAGGFDFGIGPNDSANIVLYNGKMRDSFSVTGSNRVKQSAEFINKTQVLQADKLKREKVRMDSLTIAEATEEKKLKALSVYDSIYNSIFVFNTNYADTVGSAVAAAIALNRHVHDRGSKDILQNINKLTEKFGDLVTQQSLLAGYNSKTYSAAAANKKDTLNISKSFDPKFEEAINEAFKKNKLVLIDFWASWCKPCIEEFPYLNKAHDNYKRKGFEIISISLDKNESDWQEAKKRFPTHWKKHLLDSTALDSKPAKILGIKSIPRSYLIDKKGVIYGKNLRREILSEILSQLL